MPRKQNRETESSLPSKKAKDKIAPHRIKSYEDFMGYFGTPSHVSMMKFDRMKKDDFLPAPLSAVPNIKEKTIQFLEQCVLPEWFELNLTLNNPKNETEKDYFLFAIFRPLATLTHFNVHVDSHQEVSDEDIYQAASNAISASRRVREIGESEKGPVDPLPVPTIPPVIDVEDGDCLAKIYIAMEYHVKNSETSSRGGSEFVIKDENDSPVCFVEAKFGPVEDGIYQCAAYLVVLASENRQDGPVWGIVTNLETWIFLKLEDHQIKVSGKTSLFEVQLDFAPGAFRIFAFLFQIFKFPASGSFEGAIKSQSEKVAKFVSDCLSLIKE